MIDGWALLDRLERNAESFKAEEVRHNAAGEYHLAAHFGVKWQTMIQVIRLVQEVLEKSEKKT